MILLRVFLMVLLAAGCLSAQPVKIAFWNVEWFPGGSPKATAAEAATQIAQVQPVLAKLDPDVIGFEEIRDWEAAGIALKELPATAVQVCSTFAETDGEITKQQVAIAGRLPAIGAWWETWKAGSEITPKRGFSFAAFQPSPENVLLVYGVHLKSNRGDAKENQAMREESASQFLSHAAAMEKAYSPLGKVTIVVGGDFNTSIDDPRFSDEGTLRMLESAGFQSCWKNVPFARRVTLPSSPNPNPARPPFPDACFDHIYVKGAKILSAAVEIPDPSPSDHRPIVTEIELPDR